MQIFCKSGLHSNFFSPHVLQLKQCFWHVLLPLSWHLKEMLTAHEAGKKQGGTAASEQPTQEERWQPEQASGNYIDSLKATTALSFSPNPGAEKLHRFQARISSVGEKKKPTNKGEEPRSTWMTKAIAVCTLICMADSSAGKQ